MSEPADPWREYRRRRNLVLVTFLRYLPLVFVTAVAADRLMHTSAPAIVVALVWMVFLAVAGVRCQRFRCPRCGNVFNSKAWLKRPMLRVVSTAGCLGMRRLWRITRILDGVMRDPNGTPT